MYVKDLRDTEKVGFFFEDNEVVYRNREIIWVIKKIEKEVILRLKDILEKECQSLRG